MTRPCWWTAMFPPPRPCRSKRWKAARSRVPSSPRWKSSARRAVWTRSRTRSCAIGITGMTVSHVLGCGQQKGKPEFYRGVQVEPTLLPKVQLDVVVSKVPVSQRHRRGQEGALYRPYRRRQNLRLRCGKRRQGAYRRGRLRRASGRRIIRPPHRAGRFPPPISVRRINMPRSSEKNTEERGAFTFSAGGRLHTAGRSIRTGFSSVHGRRAQTQRR